MNKKEEYCFVFERYDSLLNENASTSNRGIFSVQWSHTERQPFVLANITLHRIVRNEFMEYHD